MKKIQLLRDFLGDPYSITTIDMEEVIYRDLGNGFDFEVSGIKAGSETYSLYVWKLCPHKEIVGVYHKIHGQQMLKDLLGFYAAKYQNLSDQIQVEREELV